MTVKPNEAGMAPEDEEVTGAPKEDMECQGRNKPTDNYDHMNATEGQDINDNDKGEDGGGDGGGGGSIGEAEHEDETYQHHESDISHHHHKNSHQHHLTQETEAPYKLVPPDGGWSWMVVLGTFIINTLVPTVGPCYGVLFSEYLLDEGSSSTTTAWIFNVYCFLFSVGGLFVGPLTKEYGWRRIALSGCVLAALGQMISAFTPDPLFLFFSFSLLTGFGVGVVCFICFTILPHYFERRLGLANAIMLCGISLAQFIAPPIAQFLEASYGFRGASMIIGALVLNGCIGASFFQPSEWHQKKVPLEENLEEDTPEVLTTDKVATPPELNIGLVHSNSKASFPGGVADAETEAVLVVRERLLKGLGSRRESLSSCKGSSKYSSTLSLSLLDAKSFVAVPVEDDLANGGKMQEDQEDILPVRIMKSLKKDLEATKSLRVCIIVLADTLCFNAYLNFMMTVPFAMLEAGFPLEASAWCLSTCAGFNMVTRFILCSLADWPRFNKRLTYIIGFALVASSMVVFPLLPSVEWLMVAMAVLGAGIGGNLGMLNLIVIETLGKETFGPVIGVDSLSVAVGFICFGPFIGFVRDMSQSYAVSMFIMGGMVTVGMLSWLFMGVAERFDSRKAKSKRLTEALQKSCRE